MTESTQGIDKRPTHRFEDTIVWERCYFWRSEINIDLIPYTVWYSASEVFVHLPCPSSNLVYNSLESTLVQTFRRTWYWWYSYPNKLSWRSLNSETASVLFKLKPCIPTKKWYNLVTCCVYKRIQKPE